MAPVTEEDQIRVKALLTEALTVLCKDAIRHDAQISIEGLLGITVDHRDIMLVNINETLYAEVKTDGRRKSGKGGKRPATGSPSPAKKSKPPKPKRKRKDQDQQQVSPLVIRPGLGHVTIKQEIDASDYYVSQMAANYDDDEADTPKKITPKKKKRRSVPNLEEVTLNPDTMVAIQKTILEQEGCVVLSRILQRRKNKFSASHLIHCMRDMSLSQSDRFYVGEYKEIGNIKIFYKCPPELLHIDALARYSITPQEYTSLYYHEFKPNSGCPTDWASYMATVLSNTPYNPMLFPIDSMGLTPEEKNLMLSKQLERQRAFQEAAANSDLEYQDDVEGHLEEVEEQGVEQDLPQHDTPGVGLSLTIGGGSNHHSGVGVLGHDMHIHDMHGHETIEETVVCQEGIEADDCAEMIETETVIEDTLVMAEDYSSPT